MSFHRRIVKAKKKLVMLNGTSTPQEDLQKIIAWRGYENPLQAVRAASGKIIETETAAMKREFPEIGRRIAKNTPAERIAILEKLDAIGRENVEKALKKGFKLQEMLRYPNMKEFADCIKWITPKRVKQLMGFGLNAANARSYCRLFEKRSPQEIQKFFEELKRGGINPNKLDPRYYRQFYRVGIMNYGLTEADAGSWSTIEAPDRETAMEIARTRSRRLLTKRRKRFFDFRRFGKPLFSKGYQLNQSQQESLAAKDIKAFDFSGEIRRIASSNRRVGKYPNRHAYCLEVDEIRDLIKKAKPKRQHLVGVLGFADLAIQLDGKRIHIFEVQSDIVRALGAAGEKYKNWAEMAILGVADFAAKKGIEQITMSSPHIIKQVWPQLGKKLAQELYYDLPKKMGFEILLAKKKVSHYDSSFGEQRVGKSRVFWGVKVETIKKKFPEFFK